MINNETRLVTGCSDSELRVWEIKYKEDNNNELVEVEEKKLKFSTENDENDDDTHKTKVRYHYIFF